LAKKLYIKTYGCQMNVYDSTRMADALAPEAATHDEQRSARRRPRDRAKMVVFSCLDQKPRGRADFRALHEQLGRAGFSQPPLIALKQSCSG
jgi:hypothetical protein